MKLPASVLAKLCLTGVVASAGCETAVDFEHRSAPPTPAAKREVQHVEVELGRIATEPAVPSFATPPPAAAPIPRPTVTRTPVIPKPTVAPKSRAHVCGPCGMG